MKSLIATINIVMSAVCLFANPIDFSIYKLDSNNPENKPTLLILSGIQGDEPGGYNAVSILLKHYKITNGSVWVVPNLNQHSIIKNNRGIYGDMNRKFAAISANDPEYNIIQNIKQLILSDNMGVILHLHDGSGFYREHYISNLLNQNRWGNCSIIDQETLLERNDLISSVNSIVSHINNHLLDELHRYRVRNTNTKDGDKEQEKSLTYFATLNKKMAFANEASKSLPLNQRVYYHLLGIEGMLNNLNIEFTRDFDLKLENINGLINDKNMNIIINNIIELPLHNLKKQLNFFPMPRDFNNELHFTSNTPIVWLFEDNGMLRIKNGNRNMVQLKPFFVDFDDSLQEVLLMIDGEAINAPIGTVVRAKERFSVPNLPYRVNVIGFHKEGLKSEADIEIAQKDLTPKFAIDKNNKKFRIEFYKQTEKQPDKFAGMIIVEFE